MVLEMYFGVFEVFFLSQRTELIELLSRAQVTRG